MLNAPSRSTSSRRAARLSVASRAEKIPLHRQLADLRVQVPDRRLVLGVARRSAAREDFLQPVDCLALPGAYLVRMDLVLSCDRLHGTVAPQRLERHPLLEGRRVLPGAGFSAAAPASGVGGHEEKGARRPFQDAGLEWRPHGHPEPVRVHDFPDKALGKAIPYGVYDLTHDAGW